MHVSVVSRIVNLPREHLVTRTRHFWRAPWQTMPMQTIKRPAVHFASTRSDPEVMNTGLRWQKILPKRWEKPRLALERHGDPIVTCANIFQLSGFACSDALHLQTIMILGNGGMALFFLTRIPTMRVPFVWAFLKVCVNVYMVFYLTSERQPVKLTAAEFDIYEQHFMPFGITGRQFKKFWDLGETRKVPSGTRIVIEGEPHDTVELVIDGHVFRTSRGEHIRGLDSFPDAWQNPNGDAGAWIAEINSLQMIDTVAAPESVSRDLHRRKVHKAMAEQAADGAEDAQKLTLMKFKEGFGVDVDEDDSGSSSSPFATELIDLLLRQSIARWSVHAGEGVVVRSWKLKPLLNTCKKNDEMSSILRKAFSESAINKVLAMDSCKMAIPSGWKTGPVHKPCVAASGS